MLYFKPDGDFFAGDCMPFFHDGIFHLYYLLDENHHKALNGLGGHQWAHASTIDLIHWQHHPLALAIDEEFEKSICTGSIFYHEGTYYAFYATRLANWHQHLAWATSSDAIHFQKQQPNPLASPPAAYSPLHFRDPRPFQDPETGLFHLLVTAMLAEPELAGRGGCLAHLTSPDLENWTLQKPFLIPGYGDAPECPDYFFWNGWYYLIFSNALTARYRMADSPLGPWLRPPVDTLDGSLSRGDEDCCLWRGSTHRRFVDRHTHRRQGRWQIAVGRASALPRDFPTRRWHVGQQICARDVADRSP